MTSPEAVSSAPLSALIVAPALADRLSSAATLSGAGFRVTTIASFPDAKAWMMSNSPALLVADLRLAEYNGLHLVIRGRATNPSLAAIITIDGEDIVLRTDAEALRATFAVRPITSAELLACAARTLRRGMEDSDPIRAPFERRQTDRRQSAAMHIQKEQRYHDRRRSIFEAAERSAVSSR
jgi:DNA-binding NtrC family response regulator